MSPPEQPASPFPVRIPGMATYAMASELLGETASEEIRIAFWKTMPVGQALSLISQILTDIEIHGTFADTAASEVDRRWAARVQNTKLRNHLEIGSTFGVALFARQMLLLAAKEALLHCPDGPVLDDEEGLDRLVICLLGIADDNDVWPTGQEEASWGGLTVSLASEIIANLHFNRTLWAGSQLVWFERTWFRDWPKRTQSVQTVGGEPHQLFEAATGIELDDFASVAFCTYTQAAIHGFVRFPDEFFATLNLPVEATDHFVAATSTALAELRERIRDDAASPGSSRFEFDAFRQFPLVRLDSGELLVLSPNFLMQRALSEATFWDVRQYLRKVDRKREEAFHQCTTDILEYETGAALRRVFFKKRLAVLDEDQLWKRLAAGRKDRPNMCDFAVRSGRTWLLIEATDRAMPRPVVFANATVAALDGELDKVLTGRKAKQLFSTMTLLEEESKKHPGQRDEPNVYIPLVVTGETGLPWTIPVRRRTQELLREQGYSADFCASVALITLKELIMLENADALGYDIVELLRSWRYDNPSLPLDLHLQLRDIVLNSPKWERNAVADVVRRFTNRMTSPAD
ncbi:hypothetical protein NtRootA4_25610 [Arthrobacter sp. NtRootA4]|nr:hypothetical protein NtRootA2_27790 [Arthrobacter sp. NtRootA2]BCW15582.1 hypothetical protein NtRootA4_25610 [Arthrobacter sp. NtRootA4]BCW23916.1 hypothetical protein NtRootC7_27830 [Arthrobacter sp. NtRootC7]BCW28184.1 hypothetical protein NtRootC45_27840 [Arthrobacter sp. NtRootC45]BCW32454.1 hypothetical protein NtRootD5_27850 [Arthrobacter sp. NtRootD5]